MVSALVVAVLDFLIGYEISFTILYIVPVSLAAWYGGRRRMGILIALACAGLWLGTDLTAGHPYTRAGFVYWNAAVHLGFFLAISLLVSTLRSRLDAESRLARTDALTGLANARAIRDAADSVFELCQRLELPVAIAFIDLDHFKLVNDRFGHAEGDRALVMVSSVLRGCLRRTDIVGRLGGDEFVLILPNTGTEQAEAVMAKVHDRLQISARTHGWPLGFSIGVSVHPDPPLDAAGAIQMADALAYEAKNSGKNRIIVREEPPPEPPSGADRRRPRDDDDERWEEWYQA
ncbi:MAG: GGDEF domain-containing protein [Candidatus Eisenbacteria bacterium]